MSADDMSVIAAPQCGCGAQESFFWHDWVYVKTTRVKDEEGNEQTIQVADPDHPGARQMILIARIGEAKGRERKAVNNHSLKYEREPKAPKPEEVRDYVNKLREMRARHAPKLVGDLAKNAISE